jgi:hypothetical protein
MTQINVTLKLRPFVIPSYAQVDSASRPRQEGFGVNDILIHALDDEALEALCKEFRDALFMKKARDLLQRGLLPAG